MALYSPPSHKDYLPKSVNPYDHPKMKTTWLSGGKEYAIYKSPKGYYYYWDGDVNWITTNTTSNLSKTISQNKAVCLNNQPATSSNKTTSTSKQTSTKSSSSSGGSGGGSYGGGGNSYSSDIARLEKIISDQKAEIDELKKPKVWTSKELAEHFGITDVYDINHWKNTYDKATNKYFDDMIDAQTEFNDDANLSNVAYSDRLLRSYINSYRNAAPTATGSGVLAANALSNTLNADATIGESATSLNSLINNYNEQRKAELASNPVTAREQYNKIGDWLLQRGADVHAAEVQRYVDTLNSYVDKYAAARNAQATINNAAASSYASNAQAALSSAAAGAANNNYANMLNLYKGWYGENAANAYRNDLYDMYSQANNK